jgi:hypothetical protein
MRLRLFATHGLAIFLFLGGHLAMAQPVAIGVEGGVRATDDLSGTPNPMGAILNPESKRYIVGRKLEARLRWHFSFEFDALYRDIGFTGVTGFLNSPVGGSVTREGLNSWEFPMTVKYRFPGVRRLHPFAGVGYSPRILYGSYATLGAYANPTTSALIYYSGKTGISYPVSQGLVVSGGVEFGPRHLLISPEVRYVHWSADFLNDFGEGPGYSSPQNELYVLVGIAWR